MKFSGRIAVFGGREITESIYNDTVILDYMGQMYLIIALSLLLLLLPALL